MTTKENIITCRCGDSHEIEGHPASVSNRLIDGWNVALSMNNKITNLCPACYERSIELAKELATITGDRYVSVSHLVEEFSDEELEPKKEVFQPDFEIIEAGENIPEGYQYIAFSLHYTSNLTKLLFQADELKGKFKGTVLVDTVAHQGQDSSRLLTVYFDGEKFDPNSFGYQKTASRPLRQFLTDYYRQRPDVLEATVLSSVQKKLILAGVPLTHRYIE